MTIPCITAQNLQALRFSFARRAAVAALPSFGDECDPATGSLTLAVPEAGVASWCCWVSDTACTQLSLLLA